MSVPVSLGRERHISRIGRLTALYLLVAAVVTIGLAIAGALTRRSLSSHRRSDARLPFPAVKADHSANGSGKRCGREDHP
jgi:hypothetical protein